MYLVAKEDCPVNVVVHKYCVSGHSYLPNDRDFSQIENKVHRLSNLYSYRDFINIVKSCKQNKQELKVTEMGAADFFSTKSLVELITNRKKDDLNEQVKWLKMREVKVEKNSPGILFYKYSHNANLDYYKVDLHKRKSGQPPDFTIACILQPLYPNGHSVSQLKLRDIQQLMKYVPPVHHDFFARLKNNDTTENDEQDIDGFPPVLDYELDESMNKNLIVHKYVSYL